jgi:hypothetical protein
MVILQQQHSLTGDYTGYNETARPEDPLAEPKRLKQWVVWKYEEEAGRDRPAKVPYNPSTHRRAKPNDPSTWGTYQQALACKEEHEYDGVEFMFTADDIYTGFDFDNCVSPETGVIHPAVVEILGRLNTYWEVSPSGRGVKAIIKGKKPGPRCKTDKTPWGGQIEIYDKKRFFTITGNTVGGRGLPIRDAQDVLDSVYREFFPEPQKPVQPPVRMNTNHKRTLSERELLEKARNGKHGPKFVALYDRGDISWSGNDASTADYHLCSQLAFWTGGDAVWMEALFNASALGRRDKWTSRPDYRKTTIDRAIANTSRRYDPEKHQPRKGSTNTRDLLLEIQHYARLGYGWEEIAGNSSSGASDRDAFRVMLQVAWEANSLEIDMDERTLMVAGGFGKKATATKALTRLQDTHRWVVKIKDGSPGMATRYRIKDLTPSKRDHALIGEDPPLCVYECGPFLSKSVQIRNTSPITDKEFDKNGRRLPQGGKAPVNSVGKAAARVLDLIHDYSSSTGKPVPVSLLEEKTDIRRDNLKSRPIRKLIEARLILEVEGGYTTPPDVEERVEWELEISGCNKKKRQDEEKHAKEREISFIHRMRKTGADFDRIAELTGRPVSEIMDILKPPDEAPTYEELDRLKEDREIRDADGYIGDLQKANEFGYFPDPESREPHLSSTAEVSKGKKPPQARKASQEASPEPSQEPRESRLSSSGEVSKGNVPEDEHPIGCDCIECLFPAPRYATVRAKDEHHDYVSVVA